MQTYRFTRENHQFFPQAGRFLSVGFTQTRPLNCPALNASWVCFPREGTLINGTLREEHLIPVFARELKRLGWTAEHKRLIADAEGWLDYRPVKDGNVAYSEQYGLWCEEGDDLVVDLCDALSGIGVRFGLYFGAHEGDASDYGFWRADGIDSIQFTY